MIRRANSCKSGVLVKTAHQPGVKIFYTTKKCFIHVHDDRRLRITKNTNCKLLFHPTSKVGKLLHSTSLNISIGESLDLFSQDGQPTTRLRIPCAVKHCVSQALCPVHDFIARKTGMRECRNKHWPRSSCDWLGSGREFTVIGCCCLIHLGCVLARC